MAIVDRWYSYGVSTDKTYFRKPIIVLTGIEEGSNFVSNLASNSALNDVAAEKGLYKYVIKNPC